MEVLLLASALMWYFSLKKVLCQGFGVSKLQRNFFVYSTLRIWPFDLMYQYLKGAIPSMKYSIKVPTK